MNLEVAATIGHNHRGWEVPGEFDEYIKLFNEADASARALNVAVHDLNQIVEILRQSIQVLGTPSSLGRWPTEGELRQLFQAAQQKAAPLQIAYGRLPADVKKYAPAPNAVGKVS
jgi:hypothetical protein